MSDFKTVDISSIVIPERRRRQTRWIDSLASAIRDAGRLINPITVTEDMVLSAGYRRLLACKSLGWDKVPVHVVSREQLDSSLVEISENLHRQELTALERAEQTAAWKAAFLAKHPAAGHGKAPGNKGNGKGKSPIKDDKLSSLMGEMERATGKGERTVQRDCRIAENIPQDVRDTIRETPIAEKQAELLKLARIEDERLQRDIAKSIASGEGKNVRHAAKLVKGEELKKKPAPLPSGPFDVIVIDPPWNYSKRPCDGTSEGAVEYPTMSQEELLSLPVANLAEKDCILWLWTTNAHMRDALSLVDAWGFQQKTILTWVKDRVGLGEWLLGQTEHCLVAVKNNPIVLLKNQGTVIDAPRREHSRKPEEFYQLVESLCPGSKCELFARTPRPGWIQHGNQVNLFANAG